MSKERREYNRYIRWSNEIWNQKCFYETQASTYLHLGDFEKWKEARKKYREYSRKLATLREIIFEKAIQYLD